MKFYNPGGQSFETDLNMQGCWTTGPDVPDVSWLWPLMIL